MHTLNPMAAVAWISSIGIESFHKNIKVLPPQRSFLPSALLPTLLYRRSIKKKVQF
jgi:hypothetical protein